MPVCFLPHGRYLVSESVFTATSTQVYLDIALLLRVGFISTPTCQTFSESERAHPEDLCGSSIAAGCMASAAVCLHVSLGHAWLAHTHLGGLLTDGSELVVEFDVRPGR